MSVSRDLLKNGNEEMGEDIKRISYFKKKKEKNTSILREKTKDTKDSQIIFREKNNTIAQI